MDQRPVEPDRRVLPPQPGRSGRVRRPRRRRPRLGRPTYETFGLADNKRPVGSVTTPGYASSDPDALEDFAAKLGCDIGSEACTQQPIPDTGQTAWVADAGPDQDRLLSVIYERADGSLVGVATYDQVTTAAGVILVGDDSDSIGPVSEVDVTVEDAFAFVTDTDLRVLPGEAS